MKTNEQINKENLALELLDYILQINKIEDAKHIALNPIDKFSESWNVSQLKNLRELLEEIFNETK